MTSDDAVTGDDTPIACRLSGADYRERMAWIAALNREGLLSGRIEGTRLALRYRPEMAARVDELIRRERECCPFFSFDLRAEPGAIALDVDAPAGAAAAIFAEILGR